MDKKILYGLYTLVGINFLFALTAILLILNLKQTLQVEQPLIPLKMAAPEPKCSAPQTPTTTVKIEENKIEELNFSIPPSSTALETQLNQYTNTDLNFKVKYPNTFEKPRIWMIDTKLNRPDIAQITFYYKGEKQAWDECVDRDECLEGGPDNINISIYNNPKKLSAKDWVLENKDTQHIYSNYDYLSGNLENLLIDGNAAVKYSWYGLGGADEVVLLDKKENLIYTISADYMEGNSISRGDLWYVLDSFSLLKK